MHLQICPPLLGFGLIPNPSAVQSQAERTIAIKMQLRTPRRKPSWIRLRHSRARSHWSNLELDDAISKDRSCGRSKAVKAISAPRREHEPARHRPGESLDRRRHQRECGSARLGVARAIAGAEIAAANMAAAS